MARKLTLEYLHSKLVMNSPCPPKVCSLYEAPIMRLRCCGSRLQWLPTVVELGAGWSWKVQLVQNHKLCSTLIRDLYISGATSASWR
jgi:hypothetical protein